MYLSKHYIIVKWCGIGEARMHFVFTEGGIDIGARSNIAEMRNTNYRETAIVFDRNERNTLSKKQPWRGGSALTNVTCWGLFINIEKSKYIIILYVHSLKITISRASINHRPSAINANYRCWKVDAWSIASLKGYVKYLRKPICIRQTILAGKAGVTHSISSQYRRKSAR